MKATKTVLMIIAAGGLGFAAAVFWMNRAQSAHGVPEAETQPAVSETAKADTDATSTRAPARRAATTPSAAPEEGAAMATQRSPEDLLKELAAIQVTSGPGQARAQYRVLALLDQLAQAGSSALPAIRQFFASNRDVAYSGAGRNSGRGGQRNALLPPTLRFGLFDVVAQIGGAEAEQVLADSLNNTARGAELAYLTQLLEGISPGKYHDAAILASRNLLAGGKVSDPADRNNLYDVLRQFKDTSYVSTAQANLVQADGKVDPSALRYLQQSLGEKSLAIAAKTYQDGRVVDSDSKEAIARVALNYVGVSDQALELYHTATLDPQLKSDQRRNLIEDLNQDGLSDRRNPTPEDLKVIANRYALTQSYLQEDYVKNNKVLNDAFHEANKDLFNMLERAGVTPPAGAR
jgi:hypothetical protein